MKQKLRILTLSFLLVMQSFFMITPATLAELSEGSGVGAEVSDDVEATESSDDVAEPDGGAEGADDGNEEADNSEDFTEGDGVVEEAPEAEEEENGSGEAEEREENSDGSETEVGEATEEEDLEAEVEEEEKKVNEEVTEENKTQPFANLGNMSLMSGSYPDMDNPADHIQSAVFKVNNVQVTDFENVKVKNGDTASFRYDLKDLLEGHSYGPGSKLTIELPAGIFNGLKAGATTNIGAVSFSGSDVIFTLNENILDDFGTPAAAEEIFFEFSATFNKTEGGLSENITIPGFDIIILNFTPKNGTPIVKNRISQQTQHNAEYIEWEAIVNTDYSASGSVNFVDTLIGEHKFRVDDTVKLTELTVGPNGGSSSYTEGSEENIIINASHLAESNTKLTLSLDGTKAYKITYKTYPNDPGNNSPIVYQNKANYNGIDSQQGLAVITYDPPLKKEKKSDPSGSNLETSWEIKVNHNKRSLENITVTDTWTTNGGSGERQQEIVDGIKIYNESNTDVTSNFTVNHTAGEQGFSVVFGDINDAYTIKYKTKPTAGTYITSNMTVNNAVTRSDDENTFKSSGSVTYSQTSHMLEKTSPAINYAVKEIDWKIVANGAKYNLAGDDTNPVTFEDRFSTDRGFLTLKEDSLVVKVGTSTLEKDKDYTLEVLANNQGFNIKIPDNVTDKVEITYTTNYDIAGFGTNENVYKNTMTLNSNTLTVSPTHSAQRTSDEKPEQKENGKKIGVYNYADKKFEWEVLLNFNYHAFNNAIFEDVISNGSSPDQTLAQTIENIKVYKGELDAGGNFINPVQVTDGIVITPEPNKLTVQLGNINQPYKITYDSYVTNEVIPETPGKLAVTNTATLTEDGNTDPNATWTKTVGVNYTDKLVNKTGEQLKHNGQNTAGIKWNFQFNYAQSDLSNIVITDDVGKDDDGNPNQLIKEDSFKVYKVNLSGTSDSKNGGTATKEATEFTNYALNVDVKNGTFELKINENGRHAYYVEYETVYLGENGKTVKNDVKVSYQSDDGTEASDSYSFANFTYSSGGNVIKVPFVVIKTDAATGEVMSGIDFTLYHKASGNKLISGTTDSNGIFDLGFAISEATYYLTEDNVPTGYKNPGQIEFKLHRDSKETSGTYTGKQVVLVENIPEAGLGCEEFTLTVKDVDRKAVANKNVKLTNKATGQTVDVQTTTNENGEVILKRDEVKAGTYTVTVEEVILGDVEVKYVGECSYELQPEPTCSDFTVEIQDEKGNPRTDLAKVTLKHNGTEKEFTVTNGQFKVPYQMVIDGEIETGVEYSVYEGKQFLTTVEISYKDNCGKVFEIQQAAKCETFTLIVKDVDGAPRGADVTIVIKEKGTDIEVVREITDAEGKVVLTDLEPGEYDVYEGDSETPFAEFASNINCSDDVQPEPPCEDITIIVNDVDGVPRERVTLTIKDEDGEEVATATTNENGKVTISTSDLPAGDYEIYEDDEKIYHLTVSYKDEDGCQTVVIQPEPLCDYFTITKRDLKEGTKVTLKDGDGSEKIGEVEEGKVQFESEDLPAGKYELFIDDESFGELNVSYKNSCSAKINEVDFAKPGEDDPKDPKEFFEKIFEEKRCKPQVQPIDEDGKRVGEKRPISEDGAFIAEEGEERFIITLECGEDEIIVAKIVEDGGKINLVDPYGVIKVCHRDEILGGVGVELFYADTQRNRDNGRTPGTRVVLPELPTFGPNFNANPQVSKHDPQWSDVAGDYATYAWMVHPETDYYIIAKKQNYQDHDSREDQKIGGLISVEYDIVKYDFCMDPYPSGGGGGGGNSGGGTPGDGNEGGKTPGDGNEEGKSPSDRDQEGKTPGDGNEEGKNPGDGNEEGKNPGDGNEEDKTPVGGEQEDETPIGDDQEGETPISGDQVGKTPSGSEQGGDTLGDGQKTGGDANKGTLDTSNNSNAQTAGESLPQTGEERNLTLLVAGILSMIAGAFLIIYRRKTAA